MARTRPDLSDDTSSDGPAATSLSRAAAREDLMEPPRRKTVARPKGSARRLSPERASAPDSASQRQFAQILLLVGLAGSTFVALSLASWSPSDPSLSVVAVVEHTMNWCGPVGAYLADALYQGFGWASWSVLVLAGWFVLRLAGRVTRSWWNVLLSGGAVWMAAAGLDLGLGHQALRSFPPGGIVGVLTGELLVAHVGQVGGALAVGTGLLSALTALFGINWQPVAAATVERVETGTPAVGRLLGAATVAAGRSAASLGARAHEAFRGKLEEEDEDDSDPASLGRVAPVAAGPQHVALARRAPAVDEVVEPIADLPSVHGSVWSAAAAPRPRSLYEAPSVVERPTQPSPRTLVEVQLEEDADVDRPSGTRRASGVLADVYDVPSPREFPRAKVAVVAEDEELEVIEAPPPAVALAEAPSNAFGFGLGEDPPTRPSLIRPAPPVEVLPAAVVETPPLVPLVGLDEPELQRTPRARKGVAVVPGNLSSGGRTDDGQAVRETNAPFQLPPLSLLDEHPAIVGATDEGRLRDLATRLAAKLRDFGVEGRVSAIRPGPVITMFEYEPAPGIKLSKIAALADDVAMALKAHAIRIVAPLPGRGVVGVEVPNDVRQTVWARDVFASAEFRDQRHTLPIMLGKDTEGRPYVADLAKTPHLLVGGTTGSGKSVGINAMLVSLLMTRTPEELRLILVDPKMLEFELYKEIPHLLHPVVTNATLASKVLAWACEEMDRRYRMLGDWKVRNIENFNLKVEAESADWTAEKAKYYFPDWPAGELRPTPRKLPYIVVVIDELADLMMVAGKDVEMSIARIAQKARASGIHLIVATQRPSADVITGLIRSNMPSRLAYQVRTASESRIILDAMGANALLGKGDSLFVPPGVSALSRMHGPFLSDDEVKRVADFCRSQGKPNYAPAIRLEDADEVLDELEELNEEMSGYYDEIVELALEKGQISTSMIQRHLKLGYNRACLLMEQLEKQGIVGPADGAKPRKVLAQ